MLDLKERIETFQHEVFLSEDYTPQMLEEFYSYWSEMNKSKTKMRWELEKTWDLKRRLKRWFDNQNKWNATRSNNSLSNGKGSITQQRSEASSRFLEKGKAEYNSAIREADN